MVSREEPPTTTKSLALTLHVIGALGVDDPDEDVGTASSSGEGIGEFL